MRTDSTTSTDQLIGQLHDELRAVAARYLGRDHRDNMLEPAVLVHETYIRLSADPERSWSSREHFLAMAAKAMRNILMDHARQRCALKRGFGRSRIALELVTDDASGEIDICIVDDALRRLTGKHGRAAQIVELRFFAGLTNDQVADVLGVSRKTVVQDWGRARRWLAHELSPYIKTG